VGRSAWKEQATTVALPGEGLVLEAVWQGGVNRSAVIAPPHPEYGGSLDNPVVSELAFALHREGFASLRFNWRGVGASQGCRTGALDAAEADFRAAVEHLAASCPWPITAAGYSFGAAVALRVALGDPRLRALLLVAPPVRLIEALPLHRLARPTVVIVGGCDPFAPVEALLEHFDLPTARVEVIPEGDHFFAASLAELGELARAAAAR
jgi:hypothetical protein